MEKEYLVTWSINVWADSPRDAAEQCLGIHRDPESIATVFFVKEIPNGKRIKIDLDEP